ncbi:MAG: hypothetical protein FJ398_15080 [Verrucomicrobia bacterium]|nr:hypothetical protein [Verrucomicrobiota bacterium]
MLGLFTFPVMNQPTPSPLSGGELGPATPHRSPLLGGEAAGSWVRNAWLRSSAFLAAFAVILVVTRADEAKILLRQLGTNTLLQVQGDGDDDWRIQASDDLATWTHFTAFGTLLSGGTNAPSRSLSRLTDRHRFYRAVKTEGLFDPTLLRTLSLTFTQANWQSLLTRGRTTGSNTLGTLVMDNGATNLGVGIRYRGNTSFTMSGTKKSLNIELNYTNSESRLMKYKTINLNNAAGDETIMREPIYFNTMRKYSVSPLGSLVKLNINGEYWGLYSFVQQENNELIKEWFASDRGDRWRAPNIGGGTGGAPGGGRPGGGGGGFSSGLSALSWLGADVAAYRSSYELKTDNSTNAWERLVHAIDVLNNTPADQLRDKVEDVLAVDNWLWFLAVENVFADDDSYFNKGADYGFYYEPESGRIHPVEHDGNEAFVAGDVQLSPVQGAGLTTRPVLYRLLGVPELRQRYLAHMRTVLKESFNPAALTPAIVQFYTLSIEAIIADTKKNYTMTAYANDLAALKTFVTNRCNFLTNHAELRPVAPRIVAVSEPASPSAGAPVAVTADVQASAGEGIDSVWLYFRAGSAGKFSRAQMFDDGAHGDGERGDGIYGGATASFLAGAKVRYYVEARSSNAVKASSFAPARAEQETYSFRVTTSSGGVSPVVISEFMADNAKTLADPQGDYDDWIELRNVTDVEADLTGRYLSDDPRNPRKWQFPAGTKIPARGFLIVWADEDGTAAAGLHANFKLSAEGEQIFLVDSDAHYNALLDSVTFGPQQTDLSCGRPGDYSSAFEILQPTPGAGNRVP